jgi:hypothetical protein
MRRKSIAGWRAGRGNLCTRAEELFPPLPAAAAQVIVEAVGAHGKTYLLEQRLVCESGSASSPKAAFGEEGIGLAFLAYHRRRRFREGWDLAAWVSRPEQKDGLECRLPERQLNCRTL